MPWVLKNLLKLSMLCLEKSKRNRFRFIETSNLMNHLDVSQVPLSKGGSLKTKPMTDIDLEKCITLDLFAEKHNLSLEVVNNIRSKRKHTILEKSEL